MLPCYKTSSKVMKMETFEIISYEELRDFEYDIAYNPFDITGTGNTKEEYLEELVSRNEEAYEYYSQLETNSEEK